MTGEFDEARRESLARGQAEAFAAFYDRHAAALFAVARAITGSRADAEDAVQETFVDLFRARRALAAAANPKSYAMRALQRTALRVRERSARLAPLPLGIDSVASHDEAHAGLDGRLERALAALSREHREVLALKLDGELTFEEIGAALDIPADTAASRHRRALEKLRERLGGAW